MVDEGSLVTLSTVMKGDKITLHIAQGICIDRGLCIVTMNRAKETTMDNVTIDEGFSIDLPEEVKKDPTKLEPHEVFAKMRELGTLYDELKNEYVIFSMTGKRLHMRPRGNAEASEYK